MVGTSFHNVHANSTRFYGGAPEGAPLLLPAGLLVPDLLGRIVCCSAGISAVVTLRIPEVGRGISS